MDIIKIQQYYSWQESKICFIFQRYERYMNDLLLPLEDNMDNETEDIDIEYEIINDGREETAGIQKREYLADLLMQ